MTKRLAMLLAAAILGIAATLTATAGEPAPMSPSAVSTDSKVIISVEGLTCASCSLTVRRALKKMDGVEKIEPGPRESEALVTYDATKVKPEQFVEAINKLGFKAGTPTQRVAGEAR